MWSSFGGENVNNELMWACILRIIFSFIQLSKPFSVQIAFQMIVVTCFFYFW